MLMFLTENNIYDMADLEKKVGAMRGKVNAMLAEMKKVERRIDTLKTAESGFSCYAAID